MKGTEEHPTCSERCDHLTEAWTMGTKAGRLTEACPGGDAPPDVLWQDAISFVSDRKRKKIIEKIARKFMNFSPYELPITW